MKTAGNQHATQTRRDVIFADDSAAALLASHLDELDRPGESWELVKRNASRSVYRGRVGGQDVYLKHFHARSPLHRLIDVFRGSRARKEFQTALLLRHQGVDAVPVLAMKRGKVDWLVTQAVSPASPGDQWHARQLSAGPAGQGAVERTAQALAELVARMHQAGISHEDLHCGNILVRDGQPDEPRLVLMDLHRASRSRRVSRRRRAMNLAQLLHDRFEMTTRTQRLRFLRQYLCASEAQGSLRGWAMLVETCFLRHRRRQFAHQDRRTSRRNKYFSPLSLPGGWRGAAALRVKHPPADSPAGQWQFTPEQWRAALADLPSMLHGGGAALVTESDSVRLLSARLRVGTTELDVLISQPQFKSFWKRLLSGIRTSPTTRAFRLGHTLLNRGVPAAVPLVCLNRRIGPVLLDSVLISEAVAGKPLNRFIEESVSDSAQSPSHQGQTLQELTWQLGRMLQRLHDHHCTHRSLSEASIMVRRLRSSPQVVLMDLPGLRRVRRMTMKIRFQGLSRLNVSLLRCPAVNRAGRLRMLLGYLRRPGMGRFNFKPYWRVLEDWSAQKIRGQIRLQRHRQRAARRPGV